MKHFFSIIIVLLFITSCISRKKDFIDESECSNNCVTLNGFLLTGDGTIPVENTLVEVLWDGSSYFSLNLRDKAKTFSDKNGFYEMKFNLRDDELNEGFFRVKIYPGDEYLLCDMDDTHQFTYFFLKEDSTYTTNYLIPQKATLVLKSQGAENMKEDDSFFVTVSTPYGANLNYNCGLLISWRRDNYDKIHDWSAGSNQNIVIEKNIKKNGIRKITNDTLMLQSGHKLEYVIPFD